MATGLGRSDASAEHAASINIDRKIRLLIIIILPLSRSGSTATYWFVIQSAPRLEGE